MDRELSKFAANSEGTPVEEEAWEVRQTDNSVRPEDGEQDVSQDPEVLL